MCKSFFEGNGIGEVDISGLGIPPPPKRLTEQSYVVLEASVPIFEKCERTVVNRAAV
jgi:hypothetical protein